MMMMVEEEADQSEEETALQEGKREDRLERQMPQIASFPSAVGIGTSSNFFTIERMRELRKEGGGGRPNTLNCCHKTVAHIKLQKFQIIVLE